MHSLCRQFSTSLCRTLGETQYYRNFHVGLKEISFLSTRKTCFFLQHCSAHSSTSILKETDSKVSVQSTLEMERRQTGSRRGQIFVKPYVAENIIEKTESMPPIAAVNYIQKELDALDVKAYFSVISKRKRRNLGITGKRKRINLSSLRNNYLSLFYICQTNCSRCTIGDGKAIHLLLNQMSELLSIIKKKFPDPPKTLHYTILMRAYIKHGQPEKAVAQFKKIIQPDNHVYNALITAYGEMGRPDKCLETADEYAKKFAPSVFFYGNMINCLKQNNHVGGAWELYKDMCGRAIKPNVIVLSSLIAVLANNGEIRRSLDILNNMEMEHGVQPNRITYHSLIKALCQRGDYRQARKLIEEMTYAGLPPNLTTYTALMKAFGVAGVLQPALDLHSAVKSGLFGNVVPSDTTYDILLNHIGNSKISWRGDLSIGTKLYTEAVEGGFCLPKTNRVGILDLRGFYPGTTIFILRYSLGMILQQASEYKEKVEMGKHAEYLSALIPKRGLVIIAGYPRKSFAKQPNLKLLETNQLSRVPHPAKPERGGKDVTYQKNNRKPNWTQRKHKKSRHIQKNMDTIDRIKYILNNQIGLRLRFHLLSNNPNAIAISRSDLIFWAQASTRTNSTIGYKEAAHAEQKRIRTLKHQNRKIKNN